MHEKDVHQLGSSPGFVYLGTCQTHCEVWPGEGAFTPWAVSPCKALYVAGVQGQQMLVCAWDEAHLLRRQSSRPSRSQKHR